MKKKKKKKKKNKRKRRDIITSLLEEAQHCKGNSNDSDNKRTNRNFVPFTPIFTPLRSILFLLFLDVVRLWKKPSTDTEKNPNNPKYY